MPDPTHAVAPVALPSASDQFAAVLSAPLPFLLALFVVIAVLATAMWRAFEWRYGGVIDILKTRNKLAREQNRAAKEKQKDLKETIKKLERDTVNLVKRTEGNVELNPLAVDLSETTSTATSQVGELDAVNEAVTESLEGAPSVAEPRHRGSRVSFPRKPLDIDKSSDLNAPGRLK